MLATVEQVLRIPGMANTPAVPTAWLNDLLGAADDAVKRYCKRDLEMTSYVEYLDGNETRELYLQEWPIWNGQTTIAAASNGAVLPQATLNVTSTNGFCPGVGTNPNVGNLVTGGLSPGMAQLPYAAVQVGVAAYVSFTYTGTTATSFTGCTFQSSATGAVLNAATNNLVFAPVLWYDPGAYSGQAAGAFAESIVGPSTLLVKGSQWMLDLDRTGRVSNRGTIRKIGGPGQGWIGYYPEIMYAGRLSSYRMPIWPRGDRNIRVAYTAGYHPSFIPPALSYAVAMLAAQMVRIQPSGTALASENLGNYSYQVLQSDEPAMGDIRRVLASYREFSL